METLNVSTLLNVTQSGHDSLKKINLQSGPFKLAPLPYAPNSLEEAFDEQTMLLHHDKHHQAYVYHLNKATEGTKATLLELLQTASQQPMAIRNNAGGHWNHTFFWTVLSGNELDHKIPERLNKDILTRWDTFEKFQQEFEKAATTQFGSGWAWLIRTTEGLEIVATPNQDNPLMDLAPRRGWPILTVDIWEHAYYLRYQNKRPDYLKNFWKVVNWEMVDQYDQDAKKSGASRPRGTAWGTT